MNSVKIRLYIVVIFLMLYAGRCKKPVLGEMFHAITVYNNTSDTVYPYLASVNASIQYPDTALPVDKPALSRVLPNNTFNFYSREEWEKVIDKLQADTLSIFILDDEVYRDSSWQVVRDKYLVLKRYDLSVSDLKAMDWRVHYP